MFCRLLLTIFLAVASLANASAESYPQRAVKVVVPFPPGGGIDVLIRAIAEELSQKWGKPVIIENRSGAGGNIGAEAAARADPDGHTLLATVNQTLTANRFLYRNLPYDPDRSFAPITLMVQSDHILIAHPSVPARDARELVQLAKGEPGKLTYGSFGSGSQPQLIYETLKKTEGIDILHVPYKGIAPLLFAVTAGEVKLATGSAGVAGELLRGGKVKALAIAGKRRSPQFPDVPTTGELGLPQIQASIWYGLFAPAGTPEAIVQKVGDDVRALLRDPAFAERHATSKGLDVVANTPKEFVATIRDESAMVGEMIRAAGVEPN